MSWELMAVTDLDRAGSFDKMGNVGVGGGKGVTRCVGYGYGVCPISR